MLDFLVSWAEQLIIALIIIVIIEMVIPSGNNYKKYIKVILGIFLLYTILSPIISKKISNMEFQEVISKKYEETAIENQNIINYEKQIEETYKTKFKENIEEFLKSKGYKLKNIKQEISYKNEQIEINKIELSLKKEENNENIQIDKIKIKETNQISDKEIEELKNTISQTYEIDKNKIIIESEKTND